MINRNNVLDKIVLLTASLSYDKNSDLFYNEFYNEYTKFEGDEIQIYLGSGLWINHKYMYHLENNVESEPMLYREFSDEQFFQLGTVYDFGDMTISDLAFISRHIDSITTLGVQLQSNRIRVMEKMYDQMYNNNNNNNMMRSIIDSEKSWIDSLIHITPNTPSGKTYVSLQKSRFDPSNPETPQNWYNWNPNEFKLRK